MSDYAGAIGSVVSIVGTATGQVWLTAIGMGISAWGASQQVIPGPKIGDVQRQTSQEGGFRPIVYGRSNPIMGNIIADGGPKIVTRRERQGKGGPKVESESAYRTYAVGFCEGEANLLQAWRNGILVYDAEDPSMAAENAKFLEYATWYSGTLSQPVSPDIESIYGAGNAPYFRGTAYLSIRDEDVTDQRGAWSQWQVRVFRGAAKSYTTPPYIAEVVDSAGVSGSARTGIVWEPPLDSMDVSSHALDGVHRPLVVDYTAEPEEIVVSSHALDGVHRHDGPVILPYAVAPEELDVSSHALDGVHKLILIQYQNYAPEEISVSSRALNGTHGPA